MAHPPDVDSNLTLADFLNQTIGSTKGIKLDFKTIMVVEPSLKMLQSATSGRGINNPIWLNADILPGPCYDKVCTPVDHVQFLSLCTSYFPQATLSISWTTGMNMTAPENYYNWTQVISMGKLVSQISQPITFPIRAVLVQRSSKQIHWLLDLSETFTLTIWSAKYDKLDVQDLVTLRQTAVTDKRRIYYDLPPDQDKAFKDALKSADSGGDKGVTDSFEWKAAATKQCEDVLVGRNSVMISGDGGEVISVKTLYKVYAQYYLSVSGICSFIESGGLSNEKRSIKISLHVSNTTGIVTSSNTGKVFSLALHSNGAFQLSMNGGGAKEGSVKSETGSFKFSIVESSSDGKQRTFKCEITAQDSKGDKATVSLETENEPMAGHLLIGAGKQSGAVLVENVEFAAAAAARSGASTGNHYFQKIIVLWALLFSLCQM